MANRDFKVRHGLNVCGNSSLGGNVAISGNLNVGGNLSLESADLSGSLQVSGAASFGSLKVAGTTSLQGGLVVDTSLDVQTTLQADAISASGQLQVDGTTSLKNTLTVSGLTSLQGGLVVDGESDFQAKISADTISASGQVIVDQQVQADGDIIAGTTLKAVGNLCAQADAFVNANLTVTQNTDLNGNLQVSGQTSLASLKVDGTTSLDGALTVSGTACFKGDVAISGSLQIGGAGGSGVNIDQDVTIGGSLAVSGATTLCSDLNIGNAKLTISTNTGPHIQLKGDGPNTIRFHDTGSTSTTNALDLVYRATPNTLGFERASDAATVWETDADDLKTTFHNQVLISGTISAGTAIIAGDLQVSGGADFHSTLQVSGDASVGGNFSTNTLSVGGSSILSGNVQAKSNISVGGSTILSGDVQAKSDISVGGKVIVGGSTICTSAILASNLKTQFLQVSGGVSIGGVLQVSGSISAPGGIHAAAGDIQTSGTISGTQLKFVSAGGQRMTVSNLDSVSGRVGTLSATKLNWTSAGGQRMTISSATITSLSVSNITVNQQGNIARRISGTVASENSSYVTAFTVNGNNQASCVEVFFEGSIANVVVACYAEIVVNHNGDISIRTHQGQYTPLDIQVISDNNEDFAVLVKRNGGVAGTANLNFNVYPKGDETVTATATNPYSSATFTHTGIRGTKFSATGGNPHRFETDGEVLLTQNLTVSGMTSLQGGLVVDTSMDVQVAAQMNNISSSGTLKVQGTTTLSGATQIKNTLSVAGSTVLSGAVQAKNGISVGGSGTIAGVSWDKGHLRIGSADDGIAMDPNEIYFSGQGNIGTISGQLTLNPAQSIVTSKVFDSTANIQTTAIISGTQIRCTSFAGTTVDITGTLQVSGTASIGTLKVAGNTCAQSNLIVNGVAQLKSELDFIGAANKNIDFMLVSSNATTFSAVFRSNDHNSQNSHTHLTLNRGAAVDLYHNNDLKAATRSTGFYVSGTLSVTQDVKVAGQLRAAGAVSVDGSAHVAQNLQVGGTASINVLRVAGMLSAQGGLVVDTSMNVQTNLQANTISASGQVIVDQQVQADGAVIAGTTLKAVGNLCAQSNAVINGTGTFRGGVNVSGTLSANKYSFEPYGVLPAYNNANYGTITYNSAESAIELKSASDTTIGMAFPAWKVNVNSGNQWQITMQIRASAATANGVYIRLYEYDAELPNGKIAVSHDATNALVQEDTRQKALSPVYDNQPGSTAWQTLTFEYTPTGSAVWASIVILNWSGLGTNALYVREPQINAIIDNINVGSNVQVAGHVSADGYGHFGQYLQVSGTASVGTLKVGGTACLQGQALVNGALRVTQNADINGALQVAGTASIVGVLQAKGGLSITGTGTIAGVSWDKGHLRLGSATAGIAMDPNEIYFAGAGNIGTISGSLTLNPANGQILAGSKTMALATLDATNVQASGTVSGGTVRSSGGLLVGGTASINSLKVAGVISAQGGLVIDGSFDCQVTMQTNTISGSGDIYMAGQLRAAGACSVAGGGHFGGGVQVGGTVSAATLKVAGTTCLQSTTVVNGALQPRGEMDFIGATNKYMDFSLVSSNGTQFFGHVRTMNHQGQQHHNAIAWKRAGEVNLYHNNNLKAATRSTGFYVSGTLCATADVKAAGQVRAGGALSCNGTGHFGQGVQVSGTVSCTALHATGGTIQTTGVISGGTVTAPTLQYSTRVNGNNASQYDKLRVWSDGAYSIGMMSQMTGGYLNDYAMTFTMNNDADRGFVFRRDGASKAQYAMAMSVSGRCAIAGGLRVGYGVGWQGDPGTAQLHVTGDVYATGQVRAAGALSCNGTGHFNGAVQVNGSISCTGLHATGGAIQTTGAISGGSGTFAGKVKGSQICAQAQCLVNNQLRVTQGTILNGTVSIKTANGTTHWQGVNSRRSMVIRNDGSNYWFLITGQQNNANVSWNSWRPFYISLCNGETNFRRKINADSASFNGATTFVGKLTGDQISCHSIKAQSGNVCQFNSGGGDFAEYFEWLDGNPNVSDRVGRSVVIAGACGKISIAKSGQTPFGVVTGRAGFTGNSAAREWKNRYLRDDYLRIIKDENGERITNPEWNSACTYTNRKNRVEWSEVGLVGKCPVRVGEPLNPNWTKLRVISPTVEEYLVR